MVHPAVKFNNPVELPSLDEIERMDKLREEAIEALETVFRLTLYDCNIFL